MSVIGYVFIIVKVDELMVFNLQIDRERKDNQKQADQYIGVSSEEGLAFAMSGFFGHGWVCKK